MLVVDSNGIRYRNRNGSFRISCYPMSPGTWPEKGELVRVVWGLLFVCQSLRGGRSARFILSKPGGLFSLRMRILGHKWSAGSDTNSTDGSGKNAGDLIRLSEWQRISSSLKSETRTPRSKRSWTPVETGDPPRAS